MSLPVDQLKNDIYHLQLWEIILKYDQARIMENYISICS